MDPTCLGSIHSILVFDFCVKHPWLGLDLCLGPLLEGERSAGLEFLPFWPNFGHVVAAFKKSPNLVELVSVKEFCMIMALDT